MRCSTTTQTTLAVLGVTFFTFLLVHSGAPFGSNGSGNDTGAGTTPRLRAPQAATAGGQDRLITVAGRTLRCLPSYSAANSKTLLVLQFTVRSQLTIEAEVEKLYSCFFPHIVRYSHCGSPPLADEAAGWTCLRNETAAAEDAATPHRLPYYGRKATSYLQYEFMADAMERFPEFEGYVFAQDDSLINFWNFPARHDPRKVWRALKFADPEPQVWSQHANLSLTSSAAHSTVAKFWTEPTLTQVQKFVAELEPLQRQRLFAANSATGAPSFRMANSDFYYVPRSFVGMLLPLLKRARHHMLLHEIALPIIFDAALEVGEYEETPAAATSAGMTESVKLFVLYDPCFDYFHKLKPSIAAQFDFMVESVFRYGPMVGKWDCLESGKDGLTSFARIRP